MSRPQLSSQISFSALEDLSDAQRHELGAAAREESVGDQPLISDAIDLEELAREYENGDQSFVRKILWLRNRPQGGFLTYYKTRGDGDCFYRAFAFAYIQSIIHINDRPLYLSVYKHIESTHGMLERAGFEMAIFMDFWEPLRELLRRIYVTDPDIVELDDAELVKALNDPETSNSIVAYLRLVASAFLKTNASEFEPFLFAYDGEKGDGGPPSMDEFCSNHIEAIGKEADHLAITALSRALLVSLEVVYLSRSPDNSGIGAVGGDEDEDKGVMAVPAAKPPANTFALESHPGGNTAPAVGSLSVPGRQRERAAQQAACEIVRFEMPTEDGAAIGTHAPSSSTRRPSSTLVTLLHVGALLFRPGHYDVLVKAPKL
ncbi:cysteine proteinase [Tilletiaria anomala UBC 951]|uniref:ubiquitinyl hydrolase 1 n=1 Tax=Tilletiaria anomala (strain ATCC 24038 / CBS 436.72 / UBC 951) TaxID=1037660 RepID=A0A066V8C8_TILAU|nr:cysteine proteinase [Tilletiaria anomala UBC 951]KDN36548.1 cysteine proteinase [Tilletiaria anomala UBC 951]